MNDIWKKLKILEESRKQACFELGECQYTISRLQQKAEEYLDGIGAINTAIKTAVKELEKKHNISGSDYTLDLDKQEIVHEPVSDRKNG
jgi:hypothetical protein